MDVRQYIDDHADEFFGALRQWLTIPSISADRARHGDVRCVCDRRRRRRSAEWLAGHLRQTGFPVAEVWETGDDESPGLPAVFAHWPAAPPPAAPGAPPPVANTELLLKGAQAAAYLWQELAAQIPAAQ